MTTRHQTPTGTSKSYDDHLGLTQFKKKKHPSVTKTAHKRLHRSNNSPLRPQTQYRIALINVQLHNITLENPRRITEKLTHATCTCERLDACHDYQRRTCLPRAFSVWQCRAPVSCHILPSTPHLMRISTTSQIYFSNHPNSGVTQASWVPFTLLLLCLGTYAEAIHE